ncbi:PREDICTED: sulfhydryl oxidase 2-like [Ipomoea nil]|uniref:sulfhydryl oxidase 2-like n=1 Tax=Ipomoea nil TaxID=35883 RepID=UPI000900A7BD|nr:PREDICTED: sulfhydryl oxidase 2-like [Ipomoea nil]
MFNISKFLSLFVYFNLSSYGLDDEKYKNEHIQTSTANLEQIARAIYDVEEATSTAFDIILGNKMFCHGSTNDTRGFSSNKLIMTKRLLI